MTKFQDITGQKFDKLLVISKSHSNNGVFWLCKCDCGNSKIVFSGHLKGNGPKSCGCVRKKKSIIIDGASEGFTKHDLYQTWVDINHRCYSKKDKAYKNYGGRGIIMCDSWRNSIKCFIEDMGNKPTPDHSIDRIENNGNYTKENCKWSTSTEQNNNRRDTSDRFIVNGIAKTINEWEIQMNLSGKTIRSRIIRGWSEEDAILTPARARK